MVQHRPEADIGTSQAIQVETMVCGGALLRSAHAFSSEEVTTLCDHVGARHGSGIKMGDKSAIEWTEATWNPTTGCDRTSPGCDRCYALTLANRLKAMGVDKYQRDGDPQTSGPGFGITLHQGALELPYRWARPRTVFVNSMSDLFHDAVPIDFIKQVFEVMASTPQHSYQVLTKRSRRLSKLADSLSWPANVWMGVSVESNRYAFRANHLRSVPANVRFLSVEPMLGPVPNLDLCGIDWVIAGGESGPGGEADAGRVGGRTTRPMSRSQCRVLL
jgi:protein gp37